MQIISANDEFYKAARGADFIPNAGEGVIYVKFVMIKPLTLKEGDPGGLVENAQGVILCGRFDEMKAKIGEFFDSAAEQYES